MLAGKDFEAIIDTGASVTLIRRSVFEQLGMKSEKGKDLILRVGDGNRYLVTETVTVPLTFEKLTKPHTFYIYDKLPHPILLSIQFICEFYITIRANTQQISIATESLLIHEIHADKITAVKQTKLTPLTGKMVNATIKEVKTGVINVVNVAEMPFYVREGMYMVHDNQTALLLENVNKNPITIFKNQTIAVSVPNIKEDEVDLLSMTTEEISTDMFQISDTLPEMSRKEKCWSYWRRTKKFLQQKHHN